MYLNIIEPLFAKSMKGVVLSELLNDHFLICAQVFVLMSAIWL